MTLYDYCKKKIEKNPKIMDFEYNGKTYIKSELEDLKNITGTFKSEIYDEGYYDYDGTDENGPIYLRKQWLVCYIKKVGE